jgi:hypothetical protein
MVQVEGSGIVRLGNQEQIVAMLGQLDKLHAKLVRALKSRPDMMHVAKAP